MPTLPALTLQPNRWDRTAPICAAAALDDHQAQAPVAGDQAVADAFLLGGDVVLVEQIAQEAQPRFRAGEEGLQAAGKRLRTISFFVAENEPPGNSVPFATWIRPGCGGKKLLLE
ncbi:MAG: hypothetical protein ACI4O7_04040 [Aristaeellaceae bacterium]